ncbi:MAG TPA: POTRA domain-containing protein, partial [Geopsychrobacteraceae bacterium]
MYFRCLFVVFLLLLMTGLAAAANYQIADVVIAGTDRVSNASIRSVLNIVPGQIVTSEEIDQALRDIFALG